MYRSRSNAVPCTSYLQVGGLFYQSPKTEVLKNSHNFYIPGELTSSVRNNPRNTMQSLLLSSNEATTPRSKTDYTGMLVTYRAKSTLNHPTKVKPFTFSSLKCEDSEERTKKVIEEYHKHKLRRDAERERIKDEMLAERELYERAEKIAMARNRKRWAHAMASSPYRMDQLEEFSRALRVYTPTGRSRSSTPTLAPT